MMATKAMLPARPGRKAMRATKMMAVLAALALAGCTPDYVREGEADIFLFLNSDQQAGPCFSPTCARATPASRSSRTT